ncbi:thiol-disulfide oxidoreductase [Bacillus coahuilensis p1.1.43]|uniref:Thiol-disulfide oxidoreductase n=1 Tax=Bacillus coahuilensis p1.1.43 TaxID=1150625 RepID=A0A147KC59_9BACI|nr:thiol-disulfide oxidoreductase DCC family protein [Bacillus coahuilensis]KUP09132.1 thiol-disulfide oxidoreductase [Bacillus coahuilensis p1.1.43]
MHKIILFDGVCNLCDGVVQFVLKHNTREDIYFASLQSEIGKKLYEQHISEPLQKLDTFVYIEKECGYTRSTAALKLAKNLNAPWKALTVFIIVPRSIRDKVYNWVAINRYTWFGKKESCMIPHPKWKKRFLC